MTSGWSIWTQVVIFKKNCIPQRIDFVLANSGDPDKMLQYAAFHQGLHSQDTTFKKKMYSLEAQFCLRKQWRHAICSISSGSPLFANIPI